MRVLFVIVSVLLLVPGWMGEARLALFAAEPKMAVERVGLDPRDPGRTRVGALQFLGGISLSSNDPAFGGFSAIATDGRAFTLISDGGNIVRFSLDSRWGVSDVGFAALPGGPGTGWRKDERDVEAIVQHGPYGWAAFEGWDEVWRYNRDFTRFEAHFAPLAMDQWTNGGGPESMVRFKDGTFMLLSEDTPRNRRFGREGLVFAGDPTLDKEPLYKFAFMPPDGFSPSGAAELPDGRLIVLLRSFSLPFRFGNMLMVVDRAAIRPGAVVRGREIARLAHPLIHDNFEGIAVTQERGRAIIWLLSDNNQSILERSLLLKFALDER